MMPFDCSRPTSPSRRALVAGIAATLGAAPLALRAGAAEPPTFKIGLLPFGTVQWEIETLRARHLDTEGGIKIESVPLASGEAARIAFLSGSVDCVVNDLLFAARLRAEGKSVQFMPHTTTEGALIVAAGSAIRTIGDLRGKTLGIAGGALEKNGLVLRAAARRAAGLDLTRDARIVYGAPPLLAAKLETGELDAGLLYWTQATRLRAKGFRELLSVEDMLADLGAERKVAVGGYLFKAEADERVLAAFGKAVRRTETLLADEPSIWAGLRPLMQAPDEATFEALRQAYVRGIPRKPRAREIADAQSFFAILARIGGAELVGSATALPESLYVDQTIYG